MGGDGQKDSCFTQRRWEPQGLWAERGAVCILGSPLWLPGGFGDPLGKAGFAQTLASFWGLRMGAVSFLISGVRDGRDCPLPFPSGCAMGSAWRRRGFQGWFVLTHPPPKEGHCAAALTVLDWPSSRPEEVASGLAEVLPSVWKSPWSPCPPTPGNSPQELGVLLLPWLRRRGRSQGTSWRRWHRHALIFPQASLPGLSSLIYGPLGGSGFQGRSPSRTPHAAWPKWSPYRFSLISAAPAL